MNVTYLKKVKFQAVAQLICGFPFLIVMGNQIYLESGRSVLFHLSAKKIKASFLPVALIT
jgi:hypothetical protein